MKQKHIVIISLFASVIGLVLLSIALGRLQPESVSVAEIDFTDLDKYVSVEGSVKDATKKNGNVFLTMADGTGEIKVVVWKNVALMNESVYEIKKGQRVHVSGYVKEYRGSLQIVPQRPDDVTSGA